MIYTLGLTTNEEVLLRHLFELMDKCRDGSLSTMPPDTALAMILSHANVSEIKTIREKMAIAVQDEHIEDRRQVYRWANATESWIGSGMDYAQAREMVLQASGLTREVLDRDYWREALHAKAQVIHYPTPPTSAD